MQRRRPKVWFFHWKSYLICCFRLNSWPQRDMERKLAQLEKSSRNTAINQRLNCFCWRIGIIKQNDRRNLFIRWLTFEKTWKWFIIWCDIYSLILSFLRKHEPFWIDLSNIIIRRKSTVICYVSSCLIAESCRVEVGKFR